LRWVEFTGNAVREDDETGVRVLGTVRDITKKRHAEETLRQNAGLFATLIDHAPLGVYVIDAQFRREA